MTCKPNVCKCSGGTAGKGKTCPKHGATHCVKCNKGYHPLKGKHSKLTKCQLNVCRCTNGTGARGAACTKHENHECSACDGQRGYYLHADSRKCPPRECVCADGVGTRLQACALHGIGSCASCAAGFTKTKGAACAKTQCTCAHGAAASGLECPEHGAAKCAVCDEGYALQGIACVAAPCEVRLMRRKTDDKAFYPHWSGAAGCKVGGSVKSGEHCALEASGFHCVSPGVCDHGKFTMGKSFVRCEESGCTVPPVGGDTNGVAGWKGDANCSPGNYVRPGASCTIKAKPGFICGDSPGKCSHGHFESDHAWCHAVTCAPPTKKAAAGYEILGHTTLEIAYFHAEAKCAAGYTGAARAIVCEKESEPFVLTGCDRDGDGDGTADAADGCPRDPLKTAPGKCGCGVLDKTPGGLPNCNNVDSKAEAAAAPAVGEAATKYARSELALQVKMLQAAAAFEKDDKLDLLLDDSIKAYAEAALGACPAVVDATKALFRKRAAMTTAALTKELAAAKAAASAGAKLLGTSGAKNAASLGVPEAWYDAEVASAYVRMAEAARKSVHPAGLSFGLRSAHTFKIVRDTRAALAKAYDADFLKEYLSDARADPRLARANAALKEARAAAEAAAKRPKTSLGDLGDAVEARVELTAAQKGAVAAMLGAARAEAEQVEALARALVGFASMEQRHKARTLADQRAMFFGEKRHVEELVATKAGSRAGLVAQLADLDTLAGRTTPALAGLVEKAAEHSAKLEALRRDHAAKLSAARNSGAVHSTKLVMLPKRGRGIFKKDASFARRVKEVQVVAVPPTTDWAKVCEGDRAAYGAVAKEFRKRYNRAKLNAALRKPGVLAPAHRPGARWWEKSTAKLADFEKRIGKLAEFEEMLKYKAGQARAALEGLRGALELVLHGPPDEATRFRADLEFWTHELERCKAIHPTAWGAAACKPLEATVANLTKKLKKAGGVPPPKGAPKGAAAKKAAAEVAKLRKEIAKASTEFDALERKKFIAQQELEAARQGLERLIADDATADKAHKDLEADVERVRKSVERFDAAPATLANAEELKMVCGALGLKLPGLSALLKRLAGSPCYLTKPWRVEGKTLRVINGFSARFKVLTLKDAEVDFPEVVAAKKKLDAATAAMQAIDKQLATQRKAQAAALSAAQKAAEETATAARGLAGAAAKPVDAAAQTLAGAQAKAIRARAAQAEKVEDARNTVDGLYGTRAPVLAARKDWVLRAASAQKAGQGLLEAQAGVFGPQDPALARVLAAAAAARGAAMAKAAAAKALEGANGAAAAAGCDAKAPDVKARFAAVSDLLAARKQLATLRGGPARATAGARFALATATASKNAEREALYNGASPLYELAPCEQAKIAPRGWTITPGLLAKGLPAGPYQKPHTALGYTETGVAAAGSMRTLIFELTFDTISFEIGGGSTSSSVVLYTDWTGKSGTERLRFVPSATRARQTVVWDVSALKYKYVVLVVTDNDPDSGLYFNDVRMFDSQPGCLPECLRITEVSKNALRFMDDERAYELVAGAPLGDKGVGTFCISGRRPTGYNLGTALGAKKPWGKKISPKNLDLKNLPSCLEVERTGPTQYALRVEGGKARFSFDSHNSVYSSGAGKKRTTSDKGMFCIYATAKPRCAAFNGVLKVDRPMELTCNEFPGAPSCLSNTVAQLCAHDELCGDKKTTRDIMRCCDKNGNKPGKGCNNHQRRRLGQTMYINGKVTDGLSAAECATQCLMHNDGSWLHKDACTAWRLTEGGRCMLATKCQLSPPNGLFPHEWHVLPGTEPFKPSESLKMVRPGVWKLRKRHKKE